MGDSTTTDETDDSRTDGRRERRVRTDKTIILTPWDEHGAGTPRRVRLLDCSARGLGVRDFAPMTPGSQFAATLRVDGGTMVLYTVRHCTAVAVGGGEYRIGAQLCGFIGGAEDDSDEVLASLLRHGLS